VCWLSHSTYTQNQKDLKSRDYALYLKLVWSNIVIKNTASDRLCLACLNTLGSMSLIPKAYKILHIAWTVSFTVYIINNNLFVKIKIL
jgi:hypothetical protein